MRLPRWLVLSMFGVGLLAVAAVFQTVMWWWKTRPERTAREYLSVMTSEDFEEKVKNSWPDPGYRSYRFVIDPTLFDTMQDRLKPTKKEVPSWYDLSQKKAFVVRSAAYTLHWPAHGCTLVGHLVINVDNGCVGQVLILWKDAKDDLPEFVKDGLGETLISRDSQ